MDEQTGEGYFPTVANYIHLNPVRTKNFDLANERLKAYRWSSYPLYLDAAKRPDWLVAHRVLGALGVVDDKAGRSWYRKFLQKRVLEMASSEDLKDFDAAWSEIRRGWYLGSDDFRKELLKKMDEGLAGKRNDSFTGEAIREHNEVEAERLLVEGLKKG